MSPRDIDVLVVDDQPDAADSLCMVLELDGYAAQAVYSAEKALAVLEHTRPLCVLFDISMPGMDGLDLVKRLRERFKSDLVLVALTGADNTNPRVAETFDMVDHHLIKPLNPKELATLFPPC